MFSLVINILVGAEILIFEDFNFREYMENFFENSRILAVKFKRSKTGYLNCFNARIAEVSDL